MFAVAELQYTDYKNNTRTNKQKILSILSPMLVWNLVPVKLGETPVSYTHLDVYKRQEHLRFVLRMK